MFSWLIFHETVITEKQQSSNSSILLGKNRTTHVRLMGSRREEKLLNQTPSATLLVIFQLQIKGPSLQVRRI